MMRHPGYSRIALAKAAGPCEGISTLQPARASHTKTDLLENDLAPSSLTRNRVVEVLGGVKRVGQLGWNDLFAQLRLTRLACNRAAIDDDVGEIGKHLLSSVLTRNEREELWGVVDEGSPC